MFRKLKTRIKWYFRRKYQVNIHTIDKWATSIIEEYEFDSRTVIKFADRCKIGEDVIWKRGNGKQLMSGRVYGITGVRFKNTNKVVVKFFLGEFISYYRELFGDDWKSAMGGRIFYEFFERKIIEEFMKRKIRKTIAHEYRHSVQQWYLIDHGFDLVKVIEQENEQSYGEGILEKDAIRFSEKGVDIPMEVVFRNM